MMHRNAWMALSLVAVAALLSGCGTKSSDADVLILPRLQEYTAEFQYQAARELEFLPPTCPHDDVTPACSALARLVQDYDDLRLRIRTAKKAGWGW